ncbi:hypothetical protein BACCIP111895_01508 [Neobacillus rhizosphaerae]|uniref:Uncharacterized protein n=1 Tax=Neobacillus rhizosphaerae TaxID=2880965 RepID=A0ABM9EP26_9BACI|nr:hypothetical protein [Neobacillus rhizosphaerae]CAH2714345.1 hypothetical protein BACCIP111895_01508 [Neobacillus rhizosphaerae]
MKINDYYYDSANISLNESIAALIPASMIIIGNLSFFKSQEFMLWTIPFITYSFISFHFYLFRMKQSILSAKNMTNDKNEGYHHSLFTTRHLLLCYMNTPSPSLLLYFTDGNLAGRISKYRRKGLNGLRPSKMFALYNSKDEAMGFFEIKGKKTIKIGVFDKERTFLGCLEKKKLSWRKNKKELLDVAGSYIGAVEGSAVFMDEQVLNSEDMQEGRLRRGWMPIEWGLRFPEPNTPVLSFKGTLSERDKLLRMSFLINEFFIER